MPPPVLRETLLTNFRVIDENTAGAVSGNLRTLLIGRDLAYRPYENGGQGLIGAYDEGTGVVSGWPGIVAGEVVDDDTVTVFINDGLVNYYADIAAPPTIAQGQRTGTTGVRIIHNSGATVFSGDATTLPIAAEIGDYIKLNDGAGHTHETRIAGFEALSGVPFTIVVLEDTIPATVGAFFNVILAEIVLEIPVDAADYVATATNITVSAGLTAATDRTGTAYPVIAGQTFGGEDYSEAYTSYGAFRDTNANMFIELTSPEQLDTYFIGWQYPESELGFACARALAPLVSPQTTVPSLLAVALPTDDDDGWALSFSRARRRYDWYAVVPLTTTETLIEDCQTMVDARIADDWKSVMFAGLSLVTETTLYNNSLTVTVNNSQTPGFNRTVVAASDQPFAGVQAGDQVTLNTVVYVIATVVSNQVATLTTTPVGAPGTFTLTTVVHPMTVPEQAADYGMQAGAFDDRAVMIVFPPNPTWNGVSVSSAFLAAATAGLRGYTVPQQSLVGVILEPGWEVPTCSFEFLGELPGLAAAGCFVYEASIDDPDRPMVAFSNTTSGSSAITDRYESMVANTDAVDRFFKDIVVSYEGRVNTNLDNLRNLQVQASTDMENQLRTNSTVVPFGSVIVAGSVQQPTQNPVSLDQVTLPYTYTISATLQNVTLRSSITIELVV